MLKIKYLISVLITLKSIGLSATSIDKIIQVAKNESRNFCMQGMGSFSETIRSFSGAYCQDELGGSLAMAVCLDRQSDFQKSNCAAKAVKAGVGKNSSWAENHLKTLVKQDPSNADKICALVAKILPHKISCYSNPSAPVSPAILPKAEPETPAPSIPIKDIKVVPTQADKDKAEQDLQGIISYLEENQKKIDALKGKNYSLTDMPPAALAKALLDAINKKEREIDKLYDLVNLNNYSKAKGLARSAQVSAYEMHDELENLYEAALLKKKFNLSQSIEKIHKAAEQVFIFDDKFNISDAIKDIGRSLERLHEPKQLDDYFKLGDEIGYNKANLFIFNNRNNPSVLKNLYEMGIKK